MSDFSFLEQLGEKSIIVSVIELSFIILLSYYTFKKIANVESYEQTSITRMLFNLFAAIIISIISLIIKKTVDAYLAIFTIIIMTTIVNIINYKADLIFSLVIDIFSISINYGVYILSIIISFIPTIIFKIHNDYVSAFIIVLIYCLLIYNIFKIKKLKYGFSFVKRNIENSYFSMLTIDICVIILFLMIMIKKSSFGEGKVFGTTFFIAIVSIILTIKQSFNLYYKQNLLIKDLKQTKSDLEAKKQEVEKLEKENLEFSKTSHSLVHKQKALEYKLEQLMRTGIDKDSKETIKEEIENIAKEVYKEPKQTELDKTEIEVIDNIFSYMQSECIKNNIKFELQVTGNIFYMVNNLISENELEILIADHIKDAIIAINHSENINRSIMVRIGDIDGVYSLYIYDSGIEFEKEVLDNLGKKPITTHAHEGGTGMGFINTFDTLNKTKASLIIEEIGKPCIDNYTKVLIFKFDGQNEFKINSYKYQFA